MRCEVRVRKIVALAALVVDGDARDHHIHIAIVQSSKDSAPGRVDDLDLQVLVLGNGVDDVDIKTDDLLVFVLKRKRGVGGAGSHGEFPRRSTLGVSTQRKTKRSDQAKAQGKNASRLLHENRTLLCE